MTCIFVSSLPPSGLPLFQGHHSDIIIFCVDVVRCHHIQQLFPLQNTTLVGNPPLKKLRPKQIPCPITDAKYDEEILAAIHKANLRTLEPDKAELFIAPIWREFLCLGI